MPPSSWCACPFASLRGLAQTSEFIDILEPSEIVLVHGEANEMKRLRDELQVLRSSVHSLRAGALQCRSNREPCAVAPLQKKFQQQPKSEVPPPFPRPFVLCAPCSCVRCMRR
jgi:hypothetical protein